MVSVLFDKKILATFLVALFVLSIIYPSTTLAQQTSANEVRQSLPSPEEDPVSKPADNVTFIGADRFIEGEELIMSLEVDNWRLSQVVAIKTASGIQLSFTELLRALDFPIQQNSITEYKGWYIKEANNFTLSPNNATNDLIVSLESGQTSLAPADYQLLYSELYIELSEITKWFKLNPVVDFTSQTIVISPEEQLPIQAEAQRKKRRFQKFNSKAESSMPRLERGYQVLSPQTLSIQSNISHVNDNTFSAYSVLGVRELLMHNVNFFFTGNNEEPLSTARLNVSKKSVNGDLFGLLGATKYEFGDVTPARVGNSSTGRLSRGFKLSNVDLVRPVNNEVTNFAGAILPGWDVELYRNDILLAQQTDVSDGRYEFNDIALLYGTNNFELVFYGPQGQIVRENETRILSPESIDPQPITYSVSLNQVNKVLLKDASLPTGQLANGFSLAGEYSLGFGSSRLKLGHENIFGSDADTNLISIGVNTSLFDNSLFNYGVSFNDSGRRAVNMSFRTAYGGQSISTNLGRNTNNNKDSNESNISTNFGATIDGLLYKNELINLAHRSTLNVIDTADFRQLRFGNNIGLSLGRSYLFHGFEYAKEFDSEQDAAISGNVGLQHNFGPVFGKFQVSYAEFEEGFELINASADLNWVISPSIRAKVSHNRSLITDNHRSNVNINWRSDWWSLSTRFTYSDILGWQAALFANMSFSGTPEYGNFINSNRGLTNRGSLLVRVFVDQNGDYIYNEGEQLLEGVQVESVQSSVKAHSDFDGMAELVGLVPNKATDIVLVKNSIDDPYLSPIIEGVSIVPRSGNVDLVDFPLVNASELDGVMSFLDSEGQKIPAAYVNIGLFNSMGELVKTTLTEFDGFYLFTQIKPGRYSVEILENSLQAHRVAEKLSLQVEFPLIGSVESGVDAVIKQHPQQTFYLVHHGSFPTRRALEVYWQLNGGKLRNVASLPKVTYDREQAGNSYRLVLLKSSENETARSFCNALLKKRIDCSVDPITETIYPPVDLGF